MLRLGSLFHKRRAPDPEQWQPGDQAECIVSGPWYLGGFWPNAGPQRGEIRIVQSVRESSHCITGEPTVFLGFARYRGVFQASGFRKVRPRADEREAAEPEFETLIRKKKAPATPLREEVG